MDRNEVKKTVYRLIEEITELPQEEIKEDSVMMDDLEISSMEIMTLFADFEEEFNMTLDEKEMRKCITIGDVIDCIAEKSVKNS